MNWYNFRKVWGVIGPVCKPERFKAVIYGCSLVVKMSLFPFVCDSVFYRLLHQSPVVVTASVILFSQLCLGWGRFSWHVSFDHILLRGAILGGFSAFGLLTVIGLATRQFSHYYRKSVPSVLFSLRCQRTREKWVYSLSWLKHLTLNFTMRSPIYLYFLCKLGQTIGPTACP